MAEAEDMSKHFPPPPPPPPLSEDRPKLNITFSLLDPECNTFFAYPHPDGKVDPSFAPLLPDISKLVIPGDPLMSTSDGTVKSFGLGTAMLWGHPEGDGYTSVFYVKAYSPDGQSFCLRMAFNCGRVRKSKVQGPNSSEYVAFRKLLLEAQFYSAGHLDIAMRTVVPAHYGLWSMSFGSRERGGVVIFSITKWAGQSWGELVHTEHNTLENRLLIGRAFEILHDANVQHGQLGNKEDVKHILLDLESSDNPLGHTTRCYFVDFSQAMTHECKRTIPVIDHQVNLRGLGIGCNETHFLINLLRFRDSNYRNRWTTSSRVSDAVEWHKNYSARHPEQPNRNVLMAQRVKFYGIETPYANLIDFWFVDEDDHKVGDNLSAKIVVGPRHCFDDMERGDDDEEEERSITDNADSPSSD